MLSCAMFSFDVLCPLLLILSNVLYAVISPFMLSRVMLCCLCLFLILHYLIFLNRFLRIWLLLRFFFCSWKLLSYGYGSINRSKTVEHFWNSFSISYYDIFYSFFLSGTTEIQLIEIRKIFINRQYIIAKTKGTATANDGHGLPNYFRLQI